MSHHHPRTLTDIQHRPSLSDVGAPGMLVTGYLGSPEPEDLLLGTDVPMPLARASLGNCPRLLYYSCTEEDSLKCCSPTINLNKAHLPQDEIK